MNTKKFIFDDSKPPIHYRPNTSNEAIIDAILIQKKEYIFPHLSPDIVFDIGANIGIATIVLADYVYHNAKVHAFEPEPENFELLKLNTAHLTNVILHNVAIDNYSGDTLLFKSEDASNLGGYSTAKKPPLETSSNRVSVVRMSQLCDRLGHPQLIKIDCEGAEYNILCDIPQIEKVDWITGELHGIKDFELLAKLTATHEIQTNRVFGDAVWHFQAANRARLFHNVARPLKPVLVEE